MQMFMTRYLFLEATSKTWTRTLTRTLKNLDPEKLDPEKHESWKTWNKYGIKKYVWL